MGFDTSLKLVANVCSHLGCRMVTWPEGELGPTGQDYLQLLLEPLSFAFTGFFNLFGTG